MATQIEFEVKCLQILDTLLGDSQLTDPETGVEFKFTDSETGAVAIGIVAEVAGYLIATMEHNGATQEGVLSEAFAEHLEDFRKNFLKVLQREVPRDTTFGDEELDH